ncbi:hypothetical protein JY494_10185 [Serratia marcescens]|uniref:Uncharacterized protein n=1 Tax=Vreelandella aquamarina TaxID=77097 RepID=A0A6F8XAW2_9GAMM|nr:MULTISPECIES: limonene-1,2-epoxide hydrolase family protein [Gammaproteobacteria]EHF4985768.1 hypothetical protein [Enterobacter hormaechei]EKY1501850.1 hypothetical protein [Enterobacter cloacae]MBN5199882.1 hypothetical protein [Serratia marcescens]HBQ6920402.1 hypothetical protein [Klebsiella pneumoniae]HDT2670291.1 hypothetical protein [Klebsiella pneumoniae subsp. pneumoniae]
MDHRRPTDGAVLTTIRLMGLFIAPDGTIAEWRDYFPFHAARLGRHERTER